MKDIEYLGINSELITYKELCAHYKLKVDLVHDDDTWSHFIIDGKETYVSMMNICNEVSWDMLNDRGLIFGNRNNPITIQGKQYRARSLKGIVSDVIDTKIRNEIRYYNSIYQIHPELRDSEFNRLVYGFIDHQLVNKTLSWCQESCLFPTGSRVLRGYRGPSYLTRSASSLVSTYYGWRAIIEEV